MTEVLTITPADLSALMRKVDDLKEQVEAVNMQPPPQWLTLKEYAVRIGKSQDTVRRHMHTLETMQQCGVTLIRNPDSK